MHRLRLRDLLQDGSGQHGLRPGSRSHAEFRSSRQGREIGGREAEGEWISLCPEGFYGSEIGNNASEALKIPHFASKCPISSPKS